MTHHTEILANTMNETVFILEPDCNTFSKITQVRIRNCEYFCIITSGDSMGVKDCVVLRFQSICKTRNIKPNDLAARSGVTPSTVYSMMNPSRREISITTIKKLCDGLDITLEEFFAGKEFKELEQEIK